MSAGPTPPSAWALDKWVIMAMVFAGIIAIGLVVIRQTGIVIPDFMVLILWIVVAVVVGALAVKLIWKIIGW